LEGSACDHMYLIRLIRAAQLIRDNPKGTEKLRFSVVLPLLQRWIRHATWNVVNTATIMAAKKADSNIAILLLFWERTNPTASIEYLTLNLKYIIELIDIYLYTN